MNKDKLIKILIPVVAVVVIIESVVLVPSLTKNSSSEMTESEREETILETEEERLPVADFVFATDTKEMKVGKSYKVVLNLVGKENFAVDAVEAYVSYDPKMVTVSGLTQGKDLPVKEILQADNSTGLISSVFLVDVNDRAGYQVKLDEMKEVFSFMVTPKSEGEFSLELVSEADEGELVTVLPETGTSDQLPFNTSRLDINVTK